MPEFELTNKETKVLVSLLDAKRYEVLQEEADGNLIEARQVAEALSRIGWYLEHPWLGRPDYPASDLDFLLGDE